MNGVVFKYAVVRNLKWPTTKAHLWAGALIEKQALENHPGGRAVTALCGTTVGYAEAVPRAQVAPEDRCKRCAPALWKEPS